VPASKLRKLLSVPEIKPMNNPNTAMIIKKRMDIKNPSKSHAKNREKNPALSMKISP
jgi:hypothetical protein